MIETTKELVDVLRASLANRSGTHVAIRCQMFYSKEEIQVMLNQAEGYLIGLEGVGGSLSVLERFALHVLIDAARIDPKNIKPKKPKESANEISF